MGQITKRSMGKTGAETSLLGFGCMRFPTKDGKIDREESTKMLDMAMAAGVNYYDTAYPYHDKESESFMGDYLAGHDRNSFYLATKLPCWEVKELADVKRLFEEQLKKLKTDYIDFYLMHALNRDRFREMTELGVLTVLEELKAQGKIRHLGFSFHDGYEAFKEIITAREWDFCQIQYNYMDQNEQATNEGYALAKKLGVPMVIMEPVKGGSLAGMAPDIRAMFEEMESGKSLASFALRWVATHDNVKVVLSGMSNIAQVEDNIRTFTEFEPLSDAQMNRITEIAEVIRSRVMNRCTGCKYCLPCPAGVAIPFNFLIWNQFHMYQNEGELKWRWMHDIKEEAKAKNCIRCGKCETVCPQGISIRENLQTLQGEIDGIVYGKQQ